MTMNDNHFMEATLEELSELLCVVKYKDNRNWQWLLEWVDNKHNYIITEDSEGGTVPATAEEIIKMYRDDDEGWRSWKLEWTLKIV